MCFRKKTEFNQSLFICLSVCLFVCLSVCLFVCLSVCLFVCLSVCLFVKMSNSDVSSIKVSLSRLSVCQCLIQMSVYQSLSISFVCLSVSFCLFQMSVLSKSLYLVRLFFCQSVCLFVCLSVCLFVCMFLSNLNVCSIKVSLSRLSFYLSVSV